MSIGFIQREKMVSIFTFRIYILIQFLFLSTFASVRLPENMHKLVVSSIHNIHKEKFNNALINTKELIKKYPKHPAGYFFYAAVLKSEMDYLQSEDYENEFYKYCDLAISTGEALLEKKREDIWAQFFIGGANGLKGIYESRNKQWLTAFKHGWRGVDLLKNVYQNRPEMKDVLYGIGVYNYWRSEKIRMFWWMPGVKDRRKDAIDMLYKIVSKGVYVKETACLNLVDILLNEKRYEDAMEIIENMLEKYPLNLIFLWREARAQLGLKKYTEAKKSYEHILTRIENEKFKCNYNIVLYHYRLSELYFLTKQYKKAVKEYEVAESFKLSEVTEERLNGIHDKLYISIRKARRKIKQ